MHSHGNCPRCGSAVAAYPCNACGYTLKHRPSPWHIALWIVAATLLLAEIAILAWVAYRDWGMLSTH